MTPYRTDRHGGPLRANALQAVFGGFGLLRVEQNSTVHRLIALFVVMASIIMGMRYLTGFGITERSFAADF